jgi:hypothetical protein
MIWAEEDRFLLMDVARYKSPPCWVKAEVLYHALKGTDSVSQKSRGLLVISRPVAAAAALDTGSGSQTFCRRIAYTSPNPVSLREEPST